MVFHVLNRGVGRRRVFDKVADDAAFVTVHSLGTGSFFPHGFVQAVPAHSSAISYFPGKMCLSPCFGL